MNDADPRPEPGASSPSPTKEPTGGVYRLARMRESTFALWMALFVAVWVIAGILALAVLAVNWVIHTWGDGGRVFLVVFWLSVVIPTVALGMKKARW